MKRWGLWRTNFQTYCCTRMWHVLFAVLVPAWLLCSAHASLSLLGVRSGLGSSNGVPTRSDDANDGPPASFALDTSNPSLTKLHGKALHFDVDSLEIAALDGLLRLGRSHAHFEKDGASWKTTVEKNSIGHYHNNRKLMHTDVSPDSIEASRLSFAGEAAFFDVYVTDNARERDVLTHLCKADRTFTPLPIGLVDPVANHAAVERCSEDMADTHMSLAAMHEYSSKLQLSSAIKHRDTQAALAQVQVQLASLSSSVATDPAAEKERVREIMTQFEAVVDSVRLDLTTRVRAVKTNFDELQQQWGAMEGHLADLDANLTERVNGALGPMQQQLEALGGRIAADTAAVNATLLMALAEARTESQNSLQNVTTAVEGAVSDLAQLSGAVGLLESRISSTLADVAANLTTVEQRLLTSVAKGTVAWEASLNASVDELRSGQQLLEANVSSAWSQVLLLTDRTEAHAEQLQNVTLELRRTQSNLTLALETTVGDLNVTFTQHVNDAVSALQESAMHEFAHTRREEASARTVLNYHLTEDLRRLNDSLAQRLDTVEGNVQDTLVQGRVLVETAEATLRAEISNASQVWHGQHAELADSVTATAQQLRTELENTTLSYYNLSAAAVAELTANTSQVVARSNSILARAIGEVNNTMLTANASMWIRLSETRLELEELLHRSLQESDAFNGEARTEVAAVSAQALQRAEAGLLQRLDAVNTSAVERAAEIDAALRGELVTLKELRDRDVKDAEQARAVAARDVAQSLAAVESATTERHSALNASTVQGLTTLSDQLGQARVEYRDLVASHGASLNTAFQSNMSTAEQRWQSALQETASNLSDSIELGTDKLRYALSNLNSTLLAAREEDRIALTVLLGQQSQALADVRQNLSDALSDVRADLSTTSVTLIESINATESRLQDAVMHQGIALTNATAVLQASVTTAEGRLNSSVVQASQDLQRVNSTLSADLLRLREEAIAADEELARLVQADLSRESQRLQTVIANSSSAVSTAANASLQAVDTSLRQLVTTTARALREDSAVEVTKLHVALSAAAKETAAHKEHATSAVAALRVEAYTNVTAARASSEAQATELRQALTALNTTLLARQAEAARNLSSAVADLHAVVGKVNSSAAAAVTAANQRIDGTEVSLQKLNHSTAASFNSVAQQLTAANATVSTALQTQWAKTDTLVNEFRTQAQRNISAVNASLSEALETHRTAASALLERTQLTLSSQIAEARAASALALQAAEENVGRAMTVLNASVQAEGRAREAGDAALSRELHAHVATYNSYVTRTDAALSEHSAALRTQSDATARQQAHLESSLANFAIQQTQQDAQLLQQVEARVSAAELQQQLGAVAVDGIRNETTRLFDAVSSATDRVTSVEQQSAQVQGELTHLQRQHEHLRAAQSNISTTVVPDLYMKVGAVQQSVADLTVQAHEAAQEASALRDRVSTNDHNTQAAVASVESHLERIESDLVSVSTGVSRSVEQLQQQYLSVAVLANTTAMREQFLSDTLKAVAQDAKVGVELQVDVADLTRRAQAQEAQLAQLTAALAETKTTNDETTRTLRETADAQARRIRDLQEALAKEQAAVRELQEDNHRLVRESATTASVDELRKLLFELQGQMLTHSSKVLDLLLQPRSAVLVHPPVGYGGKESAGADGGVAAAL
jgi:hypothetical protein